MGRYVPPDVEGVLSANQVSRKHALGNRASKLKSDGVLTVRFEMPFAVWCDACETQHHQRRPTIIGQGVRFNAEKKKIGSYYSTPLYAFRMRHPACGGWIEIQTDPKNTAYVVVSGGRQRDTGEGKSLAADDSLVGSGSGSGSGLLVTTPGEREAQRELAFSTLEKTIEDRAALAAAKERIDAIGEASARQWDDPYARNQKLRNAFRVGRKQRERDAEVTETLKEKMGLGIELLPESEEDARRARLVDFGAKPEDTREEREHREEVRLLARPLFAAAKPETAAKEKVSSGPGKTTRRLKSEIAASKVKESLVSEIVGNTRLASDPFLEPRTKDSSKAASLLPGLKRKRDPEKEPSPPPEERPLDKVAAVSSALVDYESD